MVSEESRQQNLVPESQSKRNTPLDGPAHGSIGDDEWREDIEDLARESSPGVEEGGVECASKRPLSVAAEGV